MNDDMESMDDDWEEDFAELDDLAEKMFSDTPKTDDDSPFLLEPIPV